MILGVETSLPEDEGNYSLLHIISPLMYFLLFFLMLQMQHRGGSVIILSCFHVWFFSNVDCEKNKYFTNVSEVQLELIVLRKPYPDLMSG